MFILNNKHKILLRIGVVALIFASIAYASVKIYHPKPAGPRMFMQETAVDDGEKKYTVINLESLLLPSSNDDTIMTLGYSDVNGMYGFNRAYIYQLKVISDELIKASGIKAVRVLISTDPHPATSFPEKKIINISIKNINEFDEEKLAYMIGHELGHLKLYTLGLPQTEPGAHLQGEIITKKAGFYHPCTVHKIEAHMTKLKVNSFNSDSRIIQSRLDECNAMFKK